MNRTLIKLGLIILMAVLLIAAHFLGIGHYLTLESIREQQSLLRDYQDNHPLFVIGGYFLIYIAVTALSLPGAAVLTLLGGALFGFSWGLLVVSFASTIGATLAFLLARFLLRDWIQRKYKNQLATLNAGFEREGPFYLFALRLIPIFPFFLINILTGVMLISTRNFYVASQLGMLPGTAVYVYAGTELGKIKSMSDIASPSLLAALILLGIFPLLAKKAVSVMRNWNKT